MDNTNETILVRRRTPAQTVIPTATLRDPSLSFRARGVLCFLLSFENETLVSTADLPDYGTEGRDSLQRTLRELRQQGYVHQSREAYRDDRGRQKWTTRTVISDVPTDDEGNPRELGYQASVTASNSERDTPVKMDDTPGETQLPRVGISGSITTTTSTSSSQSLGTSYLEPSTGVTAREGWPVSVSKRPRRKKKVVDDSSDFDPEKALLGEDEPQPEPEPAVDMDARRREITQKRRQRAVGPSENLARYFGTIAAQKAADGAPTVPGGTNKAALAKQFATWQREGASVDQIRKMIELYWSDSFQRGTTSPAWQDFLAKRGTIHSEGSRIGTEQEREQNRFNDAHWTL